MTDKAKRNKEIKLLHSLYNLVNVTESAARISEELEQVVMAMKLDNMSAECSHLAEFQKKRLGYK